MRRLLDAQTLVTAICLLATGCRLRLDESLIKGDSGEVVCPEGFTCSPVDERDASTAPEPDDGQTNAGSDAVGDAGDSGESGVSCGQDSDCEADAFCSVDGGCEPRCETARGCVVPSIGRVLGAKLLTAENSVFWTKRGAKDALGNEREGSIWRMRADGTSSAVVDKLSDPQIALIDDGKLYFRDGDGGSVRVVPSSGGSGSTLNWLQGPVGQVLASTRYLWWTRPVAESASTAQVYRRSREGDGPDELAAVLPGRTILAATDNAIIFVQELAGRYRQLLMLEEVVGGPRRMLADAEGAWKEAYVHGARVVVTFEDGLGNRWAKSVPLTGAEAPLNLSSRTTWSLCAWRAPWLLWASVPGPNSPGLAPRKISFGRTLADLSRDPETLHEIPFADPSAGFTVQFAYAPWANQLIYYHAHEQRLVGVDIPPFPCGDALSCPTGLACQSDAMCR